MSHFVEFLAITLKPGTRATFHRLYVERSLPIQKLWQIDVVANGPSMLDEDTYYAIRRLDSLAHRQKSEDAFYGSDDWKKGPREAMLGLIESMSQFVLEMDDAAVQGLRQKT